MFGVQTYFLSRAFSYLIRILFFTIDNSILDKEIFLTFLLGLNIIDWLSLIAVIVFQVSMFSLGIQFNKKLMNFSAITVYLGMIIFFFTVTLTQILLVLKKKQFEKVQAAEMNF